MITLACPIPHKVAVAVSGGPDSMSLLDFCIRGKKDVFAIHIDHRTEHSNEARNFVIDYCSDRSIPLHIAVVSNAIEQTEEAWRNFRLRVYKGFVDDGYVVATGAQLDDLVEWWFLSALHGNPKFMKAVNEEHKLIKPFLFTEKKELVDWCKRKSVPFITDPTNEGEHNSRAILRGMMGQFAKIHPGFKTSIKNRAMRER